MISRAVYRKNPPRQRPVIAKNSELKPESLKAFLHHPGGSLAKLIHKVKSLAELDQKLKKELPSFLRPHSKLAHYDPEIGKILLVVDSSAMASKWHYLKPNLLEKLRKEPEFGGLVQIDIKTDPSAFMSKPVSPPVTARQFSAGTTALLRELALSSEDKKLREGFLKLLRHGAR